MQSAKLRAKIVEAGTTQASTAYNIGISKNTFSAKMSKRGSFSVEEAKKICDFLDICDDAERAQIFLR